MSKTLAKIIDKFNYNEATELQLAEVVDFTDKQKQLMKIFWQPAFNNSWLYLSDYIIQEQLTNESNQYSIPNFYKQILKKYCIENEDYKEIDKTDELVNNFYLLNLTSKNKNEKRGGSLKKYYAITGKCYKKLLIFCLSLLKTKFLAAVRCY